MNFHKGSCRPAWVLQKIHMEFEKKGAKTNIIGKQWLFAGNGISINRHILYKLQLSSIIHTSQNCTNRCKYEKESLLLT